MEICIFTIGIALTYTMVVAPYWRAQQERVQREYEEVYHAFKLRMVRRFYPEQRHLSFSELEEAFDIDASFDNIGRLIQ
jgi:hypothetical protein